MIIHIPHILDEGQLARCRKILANVTWNDGRMSSGETASRVKANKEISRSDPQLSELRGLITSAIFSRQQFVATAFPAQIVPPSFSRYEPGDSYGNHADAGVMDVVASGSIQHVRTDFAVTLFLNSPEEYEGGELSVDDQFYGRGKVKLPAGDLVLYPASSLHSVERISRGVRLVCFFWVQSMIRDAAKRAMLRDLDQSIHEITRQSQEGQSAAKLLCLYHNLLRLWSET